jgi:V/A-type H+-transporting ATPase subunit K
MIFIMMQVAVLALGIAAVARVAIAINSNPDLTLKGNAIPGADPADLNAENTSSAGLIAIGAGLSIGLAGGCAAIGLGTAAASAAAAITEKPESFGKLLVLLALIEAIAIFGFVIAFVLSGNI